MKKIVNYYKSIIRTMDRLHIGKQDRFSVFLDIIYCRLFLHCRMDEYFLYQFYKYSNRFRKKFILWYHKKKYYKRINPHWYSKHKKLFYKQLSDGIHRQMIYMPECGESAFLEFVKKHQKVIIKPDVGSGGKGIVLHTYQNDEQSLELFRSFQEEMICEEYIVQHKDLLELNPSSVNSVRIIALWDDDDIMYISATLKCGGKADAIVDNMHSNGIGANVDIQTGTVIGCGIDYRGNTYVYHPVTATKIVGFSVPYWKESLELVRKCHRKIKECPFIGWDIAITENGPEVIEINSAPGPKIMQSMDMVPKCDILRNYIKKHR